MAPGGGDARARRGGGRRARGAGLRARERGAYTAAASSLERAARLTADPPARARRLFQAAEAAWLAGHAERADERLADARALCEDPPLRVAIDQLRGHAALRSGHVRAAHDILVAAAADAAPEQAVEMLAEATDACRVRGGPGPDARRRPPGAGARSRRSRRRGHGCGRRSRSAWRSSTPGEDGAPPLREATAILDAEPDLATDPTLLASAAIGALWLARRSAAGVLVQRAIDAARRQGAVGALPFPLWLAGRDAATSDRPHVAVALYEEAIRLARETGQATTLCAGLAGLACVEARQGRETDRTPRRRSSSRGSSGSPSSSCGRSTRWPSWSWAAGTSRPAIEHLRAKQQLLAERGIADPDVSPVPDLARDRPGHAARGLRRRAAVGQGPAVVARAPRPRRRASYERALDLHARTPDRFETARTLLAQGEALRRARQRAQAREPLRAAIATFDALGAAPWAERARRELQASGETARRRDPLTLDALTPRELQVALVVAEGHTIRETAGEALPLPQDRRPPPAERLPQARDRLARRPRATRTSGPPPDASAPTPRGLASPTMATQTIDEAKVDAFVMNAVGELGATLNAALVVIGDRLGLYKAMAGAGALTPRELADRTQTNERYVREWLNAQAAGGYVTYADGRYTLPAEHAFALADEDSPAFLPGAFQLMTAAVRDEPKIAEAFKSGAGVGWHQHSHDLFEGCERFFRPGYQHNLVAVLDSRRSTASRPSCARGARVADVGCGHGASTLIMAEAYPASDFRGFDYHGESIAAADARRPTSAPGSRSPPRRTSRARATTSSPRSTACTTWATR